MTICVLILIVLKCEFDIIYVFYQYFIKNDIDL